VPLGKGYFFFKKRKISLSPHGPTPRPTLTHRRAHPARRRPPAAAAAPRAPTAADQICRAPPAHTAPAPAPSPPFPGSVRHRRLAASRTYAGRRRPKDVAGAQDAASTPPAAAHRVAGARDAGGRTDAGRRRPQQPRTPAAARTPQEPRPLPARTPHGRCEVRIEMTPSFNSALVDFSSLPLLASDSKSASVFFGHSVLFLRYHQ